MQGTLELTSSFPRELINNTLRERTRDHRTPRDEHFTVRQVNCDTSLASFVVSGEAAGHF